MAIEHAVKIDEKEEKNYTLHMSVVYGYKSEILHILERVRAGVRLRRYIDTALRFSR
jgi:hypothetical protein